MRSKETCFGTEKIFLPQYEQAGKRFATCHLLPTEVYTYRACKQIGSKRKGDVILRGTHFDQPMLDCFKLPLVQMSFTGGIVPTKSVPSGKPQSSLHAPLDDFILINLALHNSGGKDPRTLFSTLAVR